MFLSEIHELVPSKLFSKIFGETINTLLQAIEELGPSIAEVDIEGNNPTTLSILMLGGEVGDDDKPEIRKYQLKVKRLVLSSFKKNKIQQPDTDVEFSFDMAGEAEFTVTCTWQWDYPPPVLDASILTKAIDGDWELTVKV